MLALAERRADATLEHDYERLRGPVYRAVRSRLAKQRLRFDDDDLSGFYNQAWHGVHTKMLAGERIENLAGLLVKITCFRALDEVRHLGIDRLSDGGEIREVGKTVDLEAQLDDRQTLRHLAEAFQASFSQRERDAAALCYLHDFSRREAAAILGISEQRMHKLMDGTKGREGVARRVANLVAEVREGEWCENQRSLMKAFAFGLLDPDGERYRLAVHHLDGCGGCRGFVLGLRGLGAALPPVSVDLAAEIDGERPAAVMVHLTEHASGYGTHVEQIQTRPRGRLFQTLLEWWQRPATQDYVTATAASGASGGRGVGTTLLAACLTGATAIGGACLATGVLPGPFDGDFKARPPAKSATSTPAPSRREHEERSRTQTSQTPAPTPTPTPRPERRSLGRARSGATGGTGPRSHERLPPSPAPADAAPDGSSEFDPTYQPAEPAAPAPAPESPGATEFF